MVHTYYEELVYEDVSFPVIFHLDTLRLAAESRVRAHWHQSIEILSVVSGSCFVLINGERFPMECGDSIVIPSGSLHTVCALTEVCRYYCLIIDRDFLIEKGIWHERVLLPLKIRERQTQEMIERIQREMEERLPCYKEQVKALAVEMMIGLRRRYPPENWDISPRGDKMNIVRSAMTIIDRDFDREITLEELCQAASVSKSYFCRSFRQATGQTVTQYINWIRCGQARRLLASGECNVGEAAQRCGFHNLSYFTKVYFGCYGHRPSQERKIAT